MNPAHCCDCGAGFDRAANESWKVRCIPCFKKSKREADTYWPDRAAAAESLAATLQQQVLQQAATIQHLAGQRMRQPQSGGLDRELAANWRSLIQLVHPDKHSGSETATRITQWLNALRDKLPCA